MKKLILIAGLLFSVNSFAANFQAAYIDMQAAIQATTAGKNAKKSLEKEFNKKKEELRKKKAP